MKRIIILCDTEELFDSTLPFIENGLKDLQGIKIDFDFDTSKSSKTIKIIKNGDS